MEHLQMQNSFKRVKNSAIISIPDILKMKYRRGIANKRNEETIDNTIIPLLFFLICIRLHYSGST